MHIRAYNFPYFCFLNIWCTIIFDDVNNLDRTHSTKKGAVACYTLFFCRRSPTKSSNWLVYVCHELKRTHEKFCSRYISSSTERYLPNFLRPNVVYRKILSLEKRRIFYQHAYPVKCHRSCFVRLAINYSPSVGRILSWIPASCFLTIWKKGFLFYHFFLHFFARRGASFRAPLLKYSYHSGINSRSKKSTCVWNVTLH